MLRRLTIILLELALVGALYALAWPQSLGGHVAYLRVSGESMVPTVEDRDLAVVRTTSSYDVGDVIAYRIPDGEVGAGAVVIHRVTRVEADGSLVTRGDNREIDDPWRPRPNDVIGRLWVHVPKGGSLLTWLRAPLLLATLAALLAVWIAAGFGRPTKSSPPKDPGDAAQSPVDVGSKA